IDVLNRVPMPIRGAATRLADRGGADIRRAARAFAATDASERLLAMSGLMDSGERAKLVNGPLRNIGGAALAAVQRCAVGTVNAPLADTLYIDAQLALVDDMLHYFDRTSMAYSLEVRVPFLDHEVVEYCATIPTNLKVHGLTSKYVLKRAARGLIPPDIV